MRHQIWKSVKGRWIWLLGAIIFFFPHLAWGEIKPMKLRVAGTFPPPSVSMQSYVANLWLEEITRKTEGKITFQTFWGGIPGKTSRASDIGGKGNGRYRFDQRPIHTGETPLGPI